METFLGIDVGSVTTKLALLVTGLYLPTEGRPVAVVQEGLRRMRRGLPAGVAVRGVATTGSARYLAGAVVGADLVKNEITCQACPVACEIVRISEADRVVACWGGKCDMWENGVLRQGA
jgi:activator of 2-hydroxyglutaryl-CoA dehydratase